MDMNNIKNAFASIGNEPIENDNSNHNTKSARSIKRKIGTDKLIPSQFNQASMKNDSEYEELRASIKKNGIIEPIEVKSENPDGTYTILSGHRRLSIAKELGISTVEIVTKPEIESDFDEIVYVFERNMARRQKKPYDIAAGIKDILNTMPDSSAKDQEEYFTKLMGMSRSSYYNYLNLIKLPDALFKLGKEELLTSEDGKFLASNFNIDELEDIAEEIKERMTAGKSEKDIKIDIANVISARKKTLKKGRNTARAPKTPNVNTLIKRTEKMFSQFDFGNYTIPKQEQKKKNAIHTIDKLIERLNEVKDKIEKN